MSLEIKERERDGIAILDCKGHMVLGPATEQFRGHTRTLIESGKQNIILNLLHVGHIDSSGLGELVALAQTLSKGTGQVKLVDLNQKNVQLLVITKLTTVFEIFEDEQQAVNSFFPDRQVRKFDLLTFVRDIDQEQK